MFVKVNELNFSFAMAQLQNRKVGIKISEVSGREEIKSSCVELCTGKFNRFGMSTCCSSEIKF